MVLELGLLLALAGPLGFQDDCILGLEAIRGQLDHSAPGVSTIAEPTRVDRGLTEAIRLSDGTEVQFQTGGCVHYGFSFTYPGVELTESRFEVAAAQAKQLLQETPVNDGAEPNVQLLIRALDAPHDTPGAEGETFLECGDAVCSLLVVPDQNDDTFTLTVAYDFPL